MNLSAGISGKLEGHTMEALRIAAIVLAASITTAGAADFVPFTVNESDVQQLQTYFRTNTPPAYSEPVIQWLAGLENKAQALKAQADKDAAAKADKAKPADPKK